MAKKVYEDIELIEILKNFHKEKGKVPTRRDIKQNQAISKRFGSFNNALIIAGLIPNRKIWDRDSVYAYVKNYALKNGYIGRIKWDMIKTSGEHPSSDVVVLNLKKKWEDIFRELGVDSPKTLLHYIEKYKTMENFIEYIIKLMGENNSQIHYDELAKKHDIPKRYSLLKYLRETGRINDEKWNSFIKYINLSPENEPTRKTNEEMIKDILDVYNTLKKAPSASEFDKKKYDHKALSNRFGSWNKAIEAANIVPLYKTPGVVKETDEELLDMYRGFCEKIGYMARRQDLDESDEIYSSSVFAVRFGSICSLQKLAGYAPRERKKKYTKKYLAEILLKEMKENNLSPAQLKKSPNIPAVSTYNRYFQKTSFLEIIKEIEENYKDKNQLK